MFLFASRRSRLRSNSVRAQREWGNRGFAPERRRCNQASACYGTISAISRLYTRKTLR